MDNFQIIARKICASSDEIKFWRSAAILLNNPHIINRRIAVSSEFLLCEIESPTEQSLTQIKTLDFSSLKDQEKNVDITKELENLLNVRRVELSLSELQSSKVYLRIAKLLPRDKTKFSTTLEIAIIDKLKNKLIYYHKVLENGKRSLGTDFLWSLIWDTNSEISLLVEEGTDNFIWLKEQLFTKFSKWMSHDVPDSFVSGSLILVELAKYSMKYDELKAKYGADMVKIWPENTDPMKFVYEDVAIATYLLLLWEDERKTKCITKLQSFVDLGCGNGLLVHILSSEGHPGFGIDLRARKIWNMFPSSTKLEIRTIIPSSANIFPEIDWIIGNHSDELTPWIPVIAARSSYKCRYFLLPCCAYEFDGTKYQRNDSSLSQYREYMNYVYSISEICGFKTRVDKLRIPSTKRICFIGSDRTYLEKNHTDQEVKIQEIINKRSCENKNETWSSSFKPREVVERVKNCTKVDKELVMNIIKVIFKKLLKERNVISVQGKTWNAGGMMEIKAAIGLLETDQLKQLKNECGGLQTLLKNNGHIFRTMEGKVRLMNPADRVNLLSKKPKKKKSNVVRKVKPCWFYENHPDGCFLLDEECNFRHD